MYHSSKYANQLEDDARGNASHRPQRESIQSRAGHAQVHGLRGIVHSASCSRTRNSRVLAAEAIWFSNWLRSENEQLSSQVSSSPEHAGSQNPPKCSFK